MDPGHTTIGGSRKADIRTSTIKEAALLKCRNNRIAKGKGVRLDFRLVITGFVGERVATDLGKGRLGKGEDGGREGEYQGEGERYKYADWSFKVRNNRQHRSSLKGVFSQVVR